jgi:hypothetical protein
VLLLASAFGYVSQRCTHRHRFLGSGPSPQLLDHFDVEQIRAVELADSETQVGFISAEQKEAIRDKLLEPGELLTVDPARMQLEATSA